MLYKGEQYYLKKTCTLSENLNVIFPKFKIFEKLKERKIFLTNLY